MTIILITTRRRRWNLYHDGDTDEKEFEDNADDTNAGVDTYCKIPKISPSMYKPLKLVTEKNAPLNRLSEYEPPKAYSRKLPSTTMENQAK